MQIIIFMQIMMHWFSLMENFNGKCCNFLNIIKGFFRRILLMDAKMLRNVTEYDTLTSFTPRIKMLTVSWRYQGQDTFTHLLKTNLHHMAFLLTDDIWFNYHIILYCFISDVLDFVLFFLFDFIVKHLFFFLLLAEGLV